MIVDRLLPEAGLQGQTEGGKVIQKLQGTAWIDEPRTASSSASRRASWTSWAWVRRKVAPPPEGIQRLFPAPEGQRRDLAPRIRPIHGRRKVLLVFGGRSTSPPSTWDYKKFSVATEEEVSAETEVRAPPVAGRLWT